MQPTHGKNRFKALDELEDFELEPGLPDPRRFAVIGARDFVFGRVRKLIVNLDRCEVVYLVVNTAVSNFREGKGEERLVPVAWTEIVAHRRQVRLPQLSAMGFRRLPVFHPGGLVPEQVAFPLPLPDEVEFWDIA